MKINILSRKAYIKKGFGFLIYNCENEYHENIKSVGIVAKKKLKISFYWCQHFWYHKKKENRINFKWNKGKKELIIWRLAIRFKS